MCEWELLWLLLLWRFGVPPPPFVAEGAGSDGGEGAALPPNVDVGGKDPPTAPPIPIPTPTLAWAAEEACGATRKGDMSGGGADNI